MVVGGESCGVQVVQEAPFPVGEVRQVEGPGLETGGQLQDRWGTVIVTV